MYRQRKSPEGEYFLVSKKSGDTAHIDCEKACRIQALMQPLDQSSDLTDLYFYRQITLFQLTGENVSVLSSALLLWTFFRYMNMVPASHTWAFWAAPEPTDGTWCAKSLQSAYILHSFRLLHCGYSFLLSSVESKCHGLGP